MAVKMPLSTPPMMMIAVISPGSAVAKAMISARTPGKVSRG